MASLELKSYQFRKEREKSWQRLAALVERMEKKGLRGLSGAELYQIPALYRGAVSSLSVARAISLDRNLLDYLESLVARAYIGVYGSKSRAGKSVLDFVLVEFPRAVRRFWIEVVAATTLMALGVLAGYLLTKADPDRYYMFVPEAMAAGRTPGASTGFLREGLYSGDQSGYSYLHFFATVLFTHNAKIGMLCFAVGFAAGVPVVYLLFYNGLLLGAMIACFDFHGLAGEFLAWVLPHGVTELGAVCLCGGAGLVLARSLLFPGTHGRLANLAMKGPEAARIVIGAVLLFFVAALIEGFFRQLVHEVSVRWMVALSSAAFWTFYFGFVGRERA